MLKKKRIITRNTGGRKRKYGNTTDMDKFTVLEAALACSESILRSN